MMGPYLERTGVSQNLRIEVAVTVHRLLEDLDRACQRTDLIGPIGMRNLDAFSAFSDALDGCGNRREWPRHRAGDDHDADADQDQRQPAPTSQDKCHLAIVAALPADLLSAVGIDPGK